MVIATLSPFSAIAGNENEKYPYTMFAASEDDGAITVNADNFCVNGNIASNGTIVSSGSINVNGTKTENAGENMIYIFDKIDTEYFDNGNTCEYEADYTLEDTNININVPTEVMGETTLNGNINITTALKSLSDINLLGEVKNTDDSIIFSKYGNIIIDSTNVNVNGLIYAPFGTVEIKVQNLNLNNVVIIANKIVIECSSVNANYSSNAAEFVGVESELIYISKDEWEYMTDDNDNGLPDFFEDYENWATLIDSDEDGLPDSIEDYLETDRFSDDTDGDGLTDYYEIFKTYTEPTITDSDGNGTDDGNEDFDDDGLTNIDEYNQGTKPWVSDTDNDDLSDGDEVNLYDTDPLSPDTDGDELEDGDELVLGTDPLIPDTDGDGILDSAEIFFQTLTYENDDSVIRNVSVSMEITGNINKTTSIENVMDIDILCSDVVGLVGEPFSIESESAFEEAVISFDIDTSKLKDTEFTNLIFLWYDEENYRFVELDTEYDEENGIVSTTTTHFSKYMLVDAAIWVEAWSEILDYGTNEDSGNEDIIYNTVLAIDCSSSMSGNDPITTKTNISSAYDAKYPKTCDRIRAGESYVDHMGEEDSAGVILFSSSARIATKLTNDTETLKLALQNVTNSGGTSFNSAISKSISLYDSADLESENTINRIILLSDGQSSVSDSYLDLAVEKGIQIYTIGLGSGVIETVLTYIAEYTGGYYFKADTSGELVDIYVEIVEGGFNSTDTDGDGLYDIIEQNGIRIQNGTTIYDCDPYSADTDGDGLLDGEEITPESSYSEYTVTNPITGEVLWAKGYYYKMTSNPTKVDSDGDGLEDGRNQSISNPTKLSSSSEFVIAPVDPEPMNYTGFSGLWKTYISEISNGTNTANDYLDESDEYYQISTESKTEFIRTIAAAIGSRVLDFRYDNKEIAIHSDTTQWQKIGGYNVLYDYIFELATDMEALKVPFTYNGTDYIIWAWKGDYLNIGPGTEVGFYTKNTLTETIEDATEFEQWVVDGTLPMTLSLYILSDDGSYTNSYHWLPPEEQWWITGFMADYNDYRATADKLTQVSSIDFSSDTEMYDAFKEGLKTISYDGNIICDDASHKVWIMW